jgi:hypothetical protein
MSSQEPAATFTKSRIPTFLGWLPIALVILIAAFILDDRGVVELSLPAAAGLAVGVPLLFSLFAGGTATIYPDRLDFRTQSVKFDSVAVAVREESLTGRLTGTATFDLFVPGSDTVSVTPIRQPDEFEQVLETHLPTPGEQLTEGQDERTEATRQQLKGDHIGDRRTFWEYWRADERLPETAVISKATLKSVMEVGDVEVEKLDEVEMDDGEGLSDINERDVTSSKASHPAGGSG